MTKVQEKGSCDLDERAVRFPSPHRTVSLPYIEPIGPGPRELATIFLDTAPPRVYEDCCRDRPRVGRRRLRQRDHASISSLPRFKQASAKGLSTHSGEYGPKGNREPRA